MSSLRKGYANLLNDVPKPSNPGSVIENFQNILLFQCHRKNSVSVHVVRMRLYWEFFRNNEDLCIAISVILHMNILAAVHQFIRKSKKSL